MKPTHTQTSTFIPKITPEPIRVTVNEDSRCRQGPGVEYDQVDFLEPNEEVVIEGRNSDSTWFCISKVDIPENCWVNAELLSIDQDTSVVPVLTPIPSPRPTDVSPTNTPTKKHQELEHLHRFLLPLHPLQSLLLRYPLQGLLLIHLYHLHSQFI
jgi:hypothetical protein